MEDLVKIKEEFLDYVVTFLSAETKRYYESHLNSICNFFVDKIINKDNLMRYVQIERKRGILNSTINKRIRALKQMCKYSNILIDELIKFPSLKYVEKSFNYLDNYEINKLINYLDTSQESLKTKTMIMLILFTGVRRTELLKMKYKNILLEKNCILLEHTKNKKQRFVHFTDDVKNKYLIPYLNTIDSNEYLFNYTYSGFDSVFKRLNKKLKYSHFSAHVLRHTYATILVNNNATLDFVQLSLGHKDARSTQIYTHMSIEAQHKIYNSCFKIA